MSARDDYPLRRHGEVPPSGHIIDRQKYEAMCDEVDRLRDYAQRLRVELNHHGWGDFHYGSQGQDPAVVALVAEHPELGPLGSPFRVWTVEP